MIDALLAIGGGIFVVLGCLHALYTLLDIRHPRRIVPDDPAVAAAMVVSKVRLARGGTTMWKAWVGFNFSHSLGAVLFGALCVFTGMNFASSAVPQWALPLFVLIGTLYLILGVRYWFRIPIAGIAIATACFLAAWILDALGVLP